MDGPLDATQPVVVSGNYELKDGMTVQGAGRRATMNFGQWMQAHRRSLLFVIALLAVAGALTAFRLPISLFPNVAFPRAVVSLDAGDRPAEQMATLVTMPVEEALRRVPNVLDVESKTSRGSAEISVNFDWGTDMAQATLQAQSAISEILGTLPQGTSMQVRRMDPTVFPVLAYSLTSKQQIAFRAARSGAVPDAAAVVVGGRGGARGRDRRRARTSSKWPSIPPGSRLTSSRSPMYRRRSARATCSWRPAGSRITTSSIWSLPTRPSAKLDDLRNVVVSANGATQIRLGDVATVRAGVTPQWMRVTADGQDAVLINIYQQPGANSVAMAKAIRAKLERISSADAAGRAASPTGTTRANW